MSAAGRIGLQEVGQAVAVEIDEIDIVPIKDLKGFVAGTDDCAGGGEIGIGTALSVFKPLGWQCADPVGADKSDL